MQPSAFAVWLDTFFAGFDGAILGFFHTLAEKAGFVLTPIALALDFMGDDALFFFVLAFVLLLFKKTRPVGICVILAIAVGALITNLTIKGAVARPRPFTTEQFKGFWEFVGSPIQSEFSFPSGHTTAAMASMLAICLTAKKKWLVAPAMLLVVLMGASRNYLIVHYPTDVIAGVIVGSVGAIAAYFILKPLWRLINKHSDKAFCRFMLEADVKNLFKKHVKDQESV